jgi:hypothetical protein
MGIVLSEPMNEKSPCRTGAKVCTREAAGALKPDPRPIRMASLAPQINKM